MPIDRTDLDRPQRLVQVCKLDLDALEALAQAGISEPKSNWFIGKAEAKLRDQLTPDVVLELVRLARLVQQPAADDPAAPPHQ